MSVESTLRDLERVGWERAFSSPGKGFWLLTHAVRSDTVMLVWQLGEEELLQTITKPGLLKHALTLDDILAIEQAEHVLGKDLLGAAEGLSGDD